MSNNKLSRGLYLGYLKMHSSFDTIQLVVPAKTPNVLPHCKIRDNPHISAEEWEIIKSKHSINIPLHFDPSDVKPTEVQLNFLELLNLSSNRLFKYMNVSADDALLHRLFDIEVIELNSEVSFLVICPPAESACAIPGQNDFLMKRTDLICLPLQTYEMVHLRTYQHSIIQKYSRLSCIIELDTIVANHNHREAFSSYEVQSTKERLLKLQELTGSLNSIWKSVRWLMDVIGFARDKDKIPELDMKKILEFRNKKQNSMHHSASSQLLQPPSKDVKIKSSPSRGSWPGPDVSNSLAPKTGVSLMSAEHSKSEQQLPMMPGSISSRHLSVSSCYENTTNSRKNSADSNYSTYYSSGGEQNDDRSTNSRLPPSKSEDTLVVIRKKGPSHSHRKRATTTNIASTSNASNHPSNPNKSERHTLVVHRVNNHQNKQQTSEPIQSLSSDSDSNNITPNKTKLRVSHHPSTSTSSNKKQIYENTDESTLVTFLKPTMTALQSEASQQHQRSFQDPLLIVEDEAIEMISSPFRKAPVEKSKFNSQLFGNEIQFIRSSNIAESICQGADFESVDGATIFTEQAKNASAETYSAKKSSYKNQAPLVKSDSDDDLKLLTGFSDDMPSSSSESTSILQVFAAYETGLASGTSLKLRVTTRTTAREVIDLVVKQLNMAVALKGKEGRNKLVLVRKFL